MRRGLNGRVTRTSGRRVCKTLLDVIRRVTKRGRHASDGGGLCCVSTRFLVKGLLSGGVVGLNVFGRMGSMLTRGNGGVTRVRRMRPRPSLNGNKLKQLTTYFLSSVTALKLTKSNIKLGCRLKLFGRRFGGGLRERAPGP